MFAIAMINGSIEPLHNAKISLTDRGLLFGHAVFETLLVSNNKIMEWDAHYARLQLACKKAHLNCPAETQLHKDCSLIVNEFLVKIQNPPSLSAASSCSFTPESKDTRISLKIMITGGDYSSLALPLEHSSQPNANIYIICQPILDLNLERRLKGFALKSFLDERGPFLIGIKSTNYLFNFCCLDDAKEQEFDDALLTNAHDDYTESVTSSFLWFDKQYHVYSTPPEGNCLAGTSILKLERDLQKAKIPFQYAFLNKNQTTNCAGCALISSVRGVVPINRIDQTIFNIEPHSNFFKFLIELESS